MFKKQTTLSKSNSQLITEVIDLLIKDLNFKNKSLVHINETDYFDNEFSPFNNRKYKKTKLNDLKDKVDLIFADFPFGIKHADEKDLCLSSLDKLRLGGIGIYLMPSYLRTFQYKNEKFKDEVSAKGFRFLAVLKLPRKFLFPVSFLQTTLVIITTDNGIQDTYFAEYLSASDDNDGGLLNEFISFGIANLYDLETQKILIEHKTGGLLTHESKALMFNNMEAKYQLNIGINHNISDFKGFENWVMRREIEKLDTDYGGYKYLDLKDLTDVIATRDTFNESENALYIPAIGKTKVTDILPDEYSKKKPQNYYQILIKDHRILKDYLFNFLNSELGQKSIELEFSKYEGATIARLRMSDIKGLKIPVPNLGLQEEIIATSSKINKLKELLNQIEQITSIKPISSTDQLSKLNQIYESSYELNEVEKTALDIKKGESINREFKQTFSLDIKKKTKENYLIFGCMRTVAGFLNKSGGRLYVGVADNSEIVGLEDEIGKNKIWKSKDKFLLGVKDALKYKIGEENNVGFKLLRISGKLILKIDCSKSKHEVYLDEKFYVRVGPSTEELQGSKLVEYTKERFKN
jgi:hypothetical protein